MSMDFPPCSFLTSFLPYFLLFQNRRGGGDFVAFFEAQQAHALRRAAGLADFVGVDADHLAVFGDDHDVGLFGDLQRRDHRTVAVGGLQVDDALAAARGDAVFGQRRALAEAFLGDGQHQRRQRFLDRLVLDLVEILRVQLSIPS